MDAQIAAAEATRQHAVSDLARLKDLADKQIVSRSQLDAAQASADALIKAASTFDEPALVAMFGPDNKDLVSTEDPVRDKSYAITFAELAQQAHAVVVSPYNPHKATVQVGPDHWPLPVPLIKVGSNWYFDAKSGRDESLFRRVGANELDAIEICHGFVEAQEDYALQKHDGSEVNQYAQRIISMPGKQDGLAWQNPDGKWDGPIGENIATAIDKGYAAGQPYHGYYFKILKGQGPAAPLGEMDYVIEGAMIGGFALVAAPAEYAVTGVKTFMVANDGVVYEKDFGDTTLDEFKKMERFNPDGTWTPVEQ